MYGKRWLPLKRLVCALIDQFGDSQKLRLVRILRSTVMVRVGGGWVALDEFLVKNDPCRGKSTLVIFNSIKHATKNFFDNTIQQQLFHNILTKL